MNKSYFTKWLPVEGGKPSQIPAGKDVPVMKNGKIQFMQLETAEKMHEFMQLEGYKKGIYLPAKLFLCSRDIQIGDKVKTWIHPTHWLDCEVVTIPEIHEDFATYKLKVGGIEIPSLCQYTIKVVGEISQDALSWVKEGMQFDEEDVNLHYNRLDLQTNKLLDLWLIEIKCPTCKHFH